MTLFVRGGITIHLQPVLLELKSLPIVLRCLSIEASSVKEVGKEKREEKGG